MTKLWFIRDSIATISSVFLYGININMIIQTISQVNDITNHQYRTTFYKTVEDPVTKKQYLEVVQYLYDRVGKLEPTHSNHQIDKKA